MIVLPRLICYDKTELSGVRGVYLRSSYTYECLLGYKARNPVGNKS